jgi:Protein of unknown function (DUF2892)
MLARTLSGGPRLSELRPSQKELTVPQNLGPFDRVVRLIAAVPLATCAFLAPLGPLVRGLAFGAPAIYLVVTGLGGACLGYHMMGKSSCPAPRALGS